MTPITLRCDPSLDAPSLPGHSRDVGASPGLAGPRRSSREAFVAVDTDGKIIAWDAAAEAMFGWSGPEALGRSWIDLAELGGYTIDLDGQRCVAAIVSQDSDHAPRRGLHDLAAIVEAANDAIVSVDQFAVVTAWNPAAERMFGYTAREMIGQPIGVLIPVELAAEEREILRRVIVGEPLRLHETERVRKDGARIAISLSLAPIMDSTQKVIGAAGIARDLADTKRSHDALQEAEALLKEAALVASGDQTSDGASKRHQEGWAPPLPHPNGYEHATAVKWRDKLERVCANPALLEPAFQPIINLHKGEVAGYEMLARFRCSPSSSPAAWFAAAAAYGFTPRLEAVVLSAAVGELSRLPPNCFLSLNLTPRALLSEEVQLAIAAREDWRGVVFELTEQAAVGDYGLLNEALGPFRHAGGFLAVDDVGAGHSNLRHITALRPDFVKLDRTLVRGLDRDEVNRAAVAAVGALGDRLDIWIVAEGIERLAELDALISLGVPLAQGFAIARPSPTMDPLESKLTGHLRGRSTRADDRQTLAGVIEPTTVAASGQDPATIDSLLAENPDMDFLPILDENVRPIAVAHRRHSEIDRAERPMCVQSDTLPADAALRAITRPTRERFDPLVCCDERGRYVGVIKIERLIESLATPIPTKRSTDR